ncbi:similar to Probable phospholipid-transporting ATPase ID (ATPase class I type 8B member 2) [Ectocarpus siliculosus]|uniref:Similar to Probable phospholipid-transporting ATPase ID (ATPase class I type 8B member 2) n=1 Tax=Ectocarpus siliculosus TaxID=2880 RepID=D7FX38_ECTSI|nr:similar to Probable phospholipid-transporting ATPase ID (ATPase class I type 8B member 2) [Ectocarpus siliculosus]|eukprot:CBJ26371.1 similar to Probable phospholipid-transporting ATPase ID (ATPase class I type 8B member 2) [Ectocarpus siliculosus]
MQGALRRGSSLLGGTQEYTALNFVFKNLWEQFHRPANVYFLGISILQCIKPISITGGTPTTLAPLTAVLIATSTKDGIEDFTRHQADAQENSRTVTRLVVPGQRRNSVAGGKGGGGRGGKERKNSGGSIRGSKPRPPAATEEVPWMDVQVGDVLEIRNRENIPADLVMLSCSDPKGTCFVLTSNLDGETNLKPRVVSPDLRAVIAAADGAAAVAESAGGLAGGEQGSVLALAAKGALVECDLPNQKLEHFDGALVLQGGERIPLQGKNILLRGCQLRNTEWCRGVVVYTGRETKIQMNAAEPAPKSSSLKPYVDRETLHVLCVQIFLCLVAAVFAGIRAAGSDVENMYFILGQDEEPQSPALVAFLKFWSFIIIFTNFVPISLLITLDMVKVFQSKFIAWDRQMYHEAREFDGTKRPMPAQVRSSELNEDLGRVKHIFSDKTGTLTCNIMNFRKCSIRGQMFGLGTTEIGLNYRLRNGLPVPTVPPLPPGAKRTPHVNFIDPEFSRVVENKAHPLHEAAVEFYLHLALNHEVQPEQQQDGSVVYSASNPDEGALIYAASHFGHRFLRRDGKDITVAVTTRHEQPLASQPTSKPTSSGSSNSARGGRCGSTSLSMQQQNAGGGAKISSMSPPPPLSTGGGADVCGGSPVVGGEEEEVEEKIFHVLHTFPFTSDRKRSSVVVRKGTGGVVVYCKGADNVILERLDLAKNPAELVKTVKENIAEFTRDGLRTLLTAKTERSEEQYLEWLSDFQAAETSMKGREEKVQRTP